LGQGTKIIAFCGTLHANAIYAFGKNCQIWHFLPIWHFRRFRDFIEF
jgi:hypothetical protein